MGQGTAKTTDDDCKTKITKWTALPLYREPELPTDLDLIGGSNTEGRAWRIPAERFMPGGNLNRMQYKINRGMTQIEVPLNQVVPIFVPGVNLAPELAVANSVLNLARVVAVANDPNEADDLIVQSSGFYTFPRVHSYQVGKTYYLSQSEPGEVVNSKPASGLIQPLFTVIDQTTILLYALTVED
jgi:hypothetical protein